MFRAFTNGLHGKIVGVFRGHNWIWHALLIGITYALVTSGFDWWYFESTRNAMLDSIALSAGIVGFFVPIVVSVGLYIVGEFQKNEELRDSGSAVAQASFIGWLISSTYKAFTGRIQPEFLTTFSNVDISRDFNFGFLQHGIFWGWPSSHTTVAFAGAVTLALLHSEKKLVRYGAIIYAMYIGLGVSVSIHWFSDFVAGAILGTLIGFVVAREFKPQL